MLDFDSDTMVLDLPDFPAKVVDGWKILPLTFPQVLIVHYYLITGVQLINSYRLLEMMFCSSSQVKIFLLALLN